MSVTLYPTKNVFAAKCLIALLLLASATFAQTISYSPLVPGTTFDAKTIDVNLAVGSLAGSAGASGGATYSIPIAVPPGTNGIAPSLSVEYNSMSGNGILGMGWSLSGMSAISRATRTVYHDGAAGPVELSADDRFSMDGARLIGTNGTTYGANDATYATKSESFAMIRSFTTAGVTGTGWFRVTTKDGTIMEYGNTTDSRKINVANQCVYWRLNKILYPDGNYILFNYTNVDSDLRIDQILYTGNDNLLPYNTVKFNYKIRSDVNTVYEAGVAIVNKYLVDNITVSAEGTPVKTYQFNYGWDNINSYLKEVVEKAGDGSSLNPTTFKYGDTPVETTNVSTTIPGANIQAISGDYDGDGKRDILGAHESYTSDDIPYFDSFTVHKANATGTGYTQTASQALPTAYTIVNKYDIPNSKTFLPNDFTGDGLDDVLTLNISYNGTESKLENVTIYESTNGGTSFVPHIRVVQPNYFRIPANKKFFYPGDFDGDGISEYIAILGNMLGSYEPFLCSSYPNYVQNGGSCGSISISGATSFPVTSWATADDIQPLDFNGDGKTDLMLISGSNCEIFTFQSSTAIRLYSGSLPALNQSLFFGDFNGDGKTDVIYANTNFSTLYKGISTGTNFTQTTLDLTQRWFSNSPDQVGGQTDRFVVGDYNGDGRSDIYYFWTRQVVYENPAGGNDLHTFVVTDIYYSQGDSFKHKELYFNETVNAYGRPSTVTFLQDVPMDFNGDGRTDLVTSGGTNMSYTLFNKDGTDNLLQKVSNGFNHVTEWTFQNLTAGGVFIKKAAWARIRSIRSSQRCMPFRS